MSGNPNHHRQSTSQQQQHDPYSVSYPQSAAKHLIYRIIVSIFAIFMIVIGKSNLPDDSVTCIQDTVIDFLSPVTDYYKKNQWIGLGLMVIMQVVVDVQLVGMVLYWYFKGESFRYPVLLAVLGVSKVLLNILFEVKPITGAFNQMLFPSLFFGQNFKNTYFFSGIVTFLLFNLFEFRKLEFKVLMRIQIFLIIYCIFILLSMRQNFFMDIATAFVFSHLVYLFISERSNKIDKFIGSFFNQDGKLLQK